MRTFMRPLIKATRFPPGWGCGSAMSASAVRRGSATNSGAPANTACFTKEAATGCASVMLEPMTKIILAFANSAKEFVMAPEPKDVASPATVGACQVRAQ